MENHRKPLPLAGVRILEFARIGPAPFAATDACVAPVLTLVEAPAHPHNRARGAFIMANGTVQPAPRFPEAPPPEPDLPEDFPDLAAACARWA